MSDKKILVGDMSRETAIGILKLMLEAMEVYDSIAPTSQRRNAVQMAIASLETDEAYQLVYEKPELCEDYISRKEAISWIENLRTLNEHYHPNAKDNNLIDCDSAIDHLKQVPSVLPKTKWTPIKDRMPSITGYYLIQYTRAVCADEMAVAFYSVEEKEIDPNYTWEFKTNGGDCKEVIAWMPLPTPFELQESEDIDGK